MSDTNIDIESYNIPNKTGSVNISNIRDDIIWDNLCKKLGIISIVIIVVIVIYYILNY